MAGKEKLSWGLSPAQIEEVFRDSRELVCLMQLGHGFSRVNSKWKQVLGWDEEELTTGSYLRFIHPDDLHKTLEYEQHFIPTGFHNRWRCKDNTYRYLSWTGLGPIGTSAAEERPTFSIVRDITLEVILLEERETQIRLLNQQLQFKNRVVRAISDITERYLGPLASLGQAPAPADFARVVHHFVELTESKFGLLVEQAGDSDTQLSYNDLLGASEQDEVPPVTDIQLARMEEATRRAMTTHEPARLGDAVEGLSNFVALPLVVGSQVLGVLALGNRAEGYPAQLVEWIVPLLALTSRLVREVSLLRVHVHAEALEAARRKADLENRAKSAFLANMAHELRTPLSGVIGLLELTGTESLNERDCAYIKMAKEAAASLLTILNDILDLSAIEAGEMKLEELVFDPLTVVKDVTRLLAFQAERKGIALEVKFEEGIPGSLLGDPMRLRQILIGNALKFTEHGHVLVSVKGSTCPDAAFVLEGFVAPRDYRLDATVEDTGMGMTPESMAALFQAFSQGDTSVARRFGGTGLGLFICKQLCTLMGGDIDATSEVAKGSIFHFFIRLRLPTGTTHAKEEATAEIEPATLPPLHVLVVEDNAVNQLVLKTMLKRSGCSSVTVVCNGMLAVEAAQTDAYDVILMDVQMPVMDGLEVHIRTRKILG